MDTALFLLMCVLIICAGFFLVLNNVLAAIVCLIGVAIFGALGVVWGEIRT